MIPITAGILGGAGAEGRPAGGRPCSPRAYVSGLALVYSLLGLLAGLTGTIFGAVSSNPWAYFVMANVLLVAGLAMLDVVPLQRTAPARRVGRRSRRRFAGRRLRHGSRVGAGGGAVRRAGLRGGAHLRRRQPERRARTGLPVGFSLGLTALLVVVGLVSGA